jgi:hypothetical protein
MPGGPRPPGRLGKEMIRHENANAQNPRLGGDMKARFSNFLKRNTGMYGDFLPKVPYIPINVWFWPTVVTHLCSQKLVGYIEAA